MNSSNTQCSVLYAVLLKNNISFDIVARGGVLWPMISQGSH